MQDAHPWDPPSPAVAALIRATTTALLSEVEFIFEEVDRAVLASQPDAAIENRRLAEAIRTSDRANLTHWAVSNLREPGARVPPLSGAETLEIAREVVRRGLDDTSLEAYRVGQNVAWRRWMRAAFAQHADASVLAEMLDLCARSIFTFVDDTLAAIHAAMEDERSRLASRTQSELLEVVNLILEGAPITPGRASLRLRYDLERRHTAAVVWRDGLGPGDPAALEQVAEAIAAAAGAGRPLTVLPNATTLWAWFGAPREPPPLPRLRRAIDPAGGVRVALGTSGSGLDGFRRGHLHALTTQRLMRRAAAAIPLAGYDELRLIALAGADEEAAAEFTAAILGELADADPQLRETLRVYIREGFSASRAARALFAHRNTVLARLSRARELLPVSLESDGLEVGLALELARWLRGG